MDVGVDVIRHPVGDAGAHRDGFEAVGIVGGEERRNVAALAPAHRADLLRVDEPSGDERIDAREHVPGVADAEIPDVEGPELLAVAGAAAVVGLEDQDAPRHPDIDRINRARERDRPRDAGGTAVNDDEERVLAGRIEVERLVQHAFDGGAVGALPRHDFERARCPSCGLAVHVGQLSDVLKRRTHLRNVDLGNGLRVAAHERHRRRVL